ncbi:hypothetical protein [Knoellia koreensis]|jgi:hypothetical protein|uniref:Uncharacterized protein n=1 Tax=Knoellia koreensis TaxID=2730921 RepID=A0A849HJQ0_9MICO|nr:hypothetical protein [Knoellia sp. DB2414S]NNM46551.1 hypothetical protein [Knoellia sp. DB2414S]
MTRWQYFTITPGPEIGDGWIRFGRRDLDGVNYTCQTLRRAGVWEDSDYLQRYYLLGSNDHYLTDVDPDTAASLIEQAHRHGRF